MKMTKDSFQFGRYNSLDDWGIKCIAHDYLLPPKRSAKLTIPSRNGSYSFNSKIYNERELILTCVLIRKISKAELREIAYLLSEKKALRIWNEPEKYYLAEILNPPDVIDYPREIMREFELSFICEPFAYGEIISKKMVRGLNKVDYKGTTETPTRIIIKNTGTATIRNITITATKRRS